MALIVLCQDCREPRLAAKANTKYCHHCRLLRNLEFFVRQTRPCAEHGCNRKFSPIERADAYCMVHTLGYSTLRGRCAVCETDDSFLVRPGVNVCISCVRLPELRRRLVGILQRSQAKRRAANAGLSDTALRQRLTQEEIPCPAS